tara:strand:+ start:11010 stop:11666 length:657 start_codon:yes stop_codon:yes gene_type:complete
MYNWKIYNINSNKLAIKFDNYNSDNYFNKVENSYYNHTRDLLCLTLLRLSKKKNICLDYGSNTVSISNIKNKINLKKYQFYIFNPFLDKKKKRNNLKNIWFKEFDQIEKFNKKIDFLNFGSSLQYIENPIKIFKDLKFNKKALILITATPFTLNKTYTSFQKNHKKLKQNIVDFKKLNLFLNKKKFKLIFKSSIALEKSSIKNIEKNTFFLNLLFQKN